MVVQCSEFFLSNVFCNTSPEIMTQRLPINYGSFTLALDCYQLSLITWMIFFYLFMFCHVALYLSFTLYILPSVSYCWNSNLPFSQSFSLSPEVPSILPWQLLAIQLYFKPTRKCEHVYQNSAVQNGLHWNCVYPNNKDWLIRYCMHMYPFKCIYIINKNETINLRVGTWEVLERVAGRW